MLTPKSWHEQHIREKIIIQKTYFNDIHSVSSILLRYDVMFINVSVSELCSLSLYSLNAVEWKSTLLGVILGSLRFGVEIHSQNSGIHSKVVSSGLNHSFESGFHYFERGFSLQTKWSLIWLLKEWISTPTHLESTHMQKIINSYLKQKLKYDRLCVW